MNDLFKSMQQKGLIEFKKSCGLVSFLKHLCDADFRKKNLIKGNVTLELTNTMPLPLDIISLKRMECNNRKPFQVGKEHSLRTEIKEQRN